MNKSIYPNRSQTATTKFESTQPNKIMVVPIDFAKNVHEAQLCKATGEYLLSKPLMIRNTREGLEFLKRKIEGNCRKFGIAPDSVIVCGEDPPSFAVNFIHWLKCNGLTFVRVNAKEASDLRKSSRASTNTLDLDGIAQAVIYRKGYDPMDYSGIYSALKSTTRARRQLVNQKTMLKNQIHQQIDVLFPGFLKKEKSGLEPFGTACLELLKNNFSMKKIMRMRPNTLVGIFKRHRLRNPEGVANKVRELAGTATPPPCELSLIMSQSIMAYAKLFREYENAIEALEQSCAKLLVQTPCFMLLTFPAIRPVTASEIAAELGDPKSWTEAKVTASYAGIVRRTKTTGDPNKSPSQAGRLPRDCNHRLKNAIIWTAKQIGRYRHPIRKISTKHDGSHPLKAFSNRKEVENGKYVLGTAKKLVRIIFAVVKGQTPYMSMSVEPTSLENAYEITRLEMAAAVLAFKTKLTGFDLSGVDPEQNMLSQWIKNTEKEFELSELQ